ncbi:uncharacterized protein LOC123553862 isoform X2 [Mercenaria mercenaria]|uniref:uncharacterized protein LOC123553862 isoform X2 n=1 Tax=Mercenaria mercenaria TaxID=6596 RepID=UPI00234F9EAD|nr:uncharacterized protein LOC123553862 isoform X2 [Mercenaria mercenaria]
MQNCKTNTEGNNDSYNRTSIEKYNEDKTTAFTGHKMRADFLTSFLIATYMAVGYSQTLLRCRSCTRASDLSDCNHLAACDATLEDCYLEQIFTDQHTVEFNGGCRSKNLCAQTSTSNSVGKKRATVGCSSCCNSGDDCNKRLCGIKDPAIQSSECYMCDHRSSEQSEVRDPAKCVTLGYCQANEVCYATQSDFGGHDEFYYGCRSKLICQILMEKAYEDYKICVANVTLPPSGSSWGSYCGNVGKRSTSLCHSCCADGGCNYGSCQSVNDRIFRLALQGKFDMKTLKVIP